MGTKSVGSAGICSELVGSEHMWVLGVRVLGVDVLSLYVWIMCEF